MKIFIPTAKQQEIQDDREGTDEALTRPSDLGTLSSHKGKHRTVHLVDLAGYLKQACHQTFSKELTCDMNQALASLSQQEIQDEQEGTGGA